MGVVRYRFLRPFHLALLLCGLAALGAPDACALDRVKFGVPAAPTLGSAPLTMAIDLGFFREEGLEVEIMAIQGSATLLPQLTNKSIIIGFPNPDILILSNQPGKNPLPLRFFYNVTRASVWEVVVLDESPVKRLVDLKGKKVGIGTLTAGNIPITRAMFKDIGLVVGNDVDLLSVGFGATAFRALTTGQVDALNLFDTQHTTLETRGVKIRRLPLDPKFAQLFTNGLVAHEDTIRDQRNLLVGFGRALSKGIIACDANPINCVATYWKYYPQQKPTQGSEEEKLRNGAAVMRSRLDRILAFPAGSSKRWGEFPVEGWRSFVDILHSSGEITTNNIAIDNLYTNALVPEFNRFDSAAVVAAAKAR